MESIINNLLVVDKIDSGFRYSVDLNDVILNMIKDDLINHKMVDTFAEIGIDSRGYRLNLEDSIFKLSGFTQETKSDKVIEWYHSRMDKIMKIDVLGEQSDEMDALALEILLGLKVKLPKQL